MHLDRAFGRAIRKRRVQLGLSQEALSFRAGLHRTYISQIERGIKSPSLRVVAALAEALGTQASTLVEMAEKTALKPPVSDYP